jgi:hypothetical protein
MKLSGDKDDDGKGDEEGEEGAEKRTVNAWRL